MSKSVINIKCFFDNKGNKVTLGKEIGKGGEGTVYEVVGDDKIVAKIFHQYDAERAKKVSLMTQLKNDRLLKYTAWPISSLFKNPNGEFIGFTMPKVKGFKDIHKLYSPKTRIQDFPNAGLTFLIHTASNIARAFAVVHDSGQIIGDVNHSNIVVSNNGTVMLIDCDSFQINQAGSFFPCNVGVSTHQPPELQFKSLKNINRTQNYDNFGLAVIIFQLLFMGRHPFSGKYLGSGEMPIEKAIQETRFAYGQNAKFNLMQQPPGTIPLSTYSQSIADLFNSAFSKEGIKQNGRPTAIQWIKALDDLKSQLLKCSNNEAHGYIRSMSKCPWCDFEAKTGLNLFGIIIKTNFSFKMDEIWANICSIKYPTFNLFPEMSVSTFAPSQQVVEQSIKFKKLKRKTNIITGVSILISLASLVYGYWLVIIGAIFLISYYSNKVKSDPTFIDLKNKHDAAMEQYKILKEKWENESQNSLFIRKYEELNKARNDYLTLPSLKKEKLLTLELNHRERQLFEFLDRHYIETARINGIGPNRKVILQSYGIETAKDVDYYDIINIPGFGNNLTNQLIHWRYSIENQFKYNPNLAIPKSDLNKLDKEIIDIQNKLERKLLSGEEELKRIVFQTNHRRNLLKAEAEKILYNYYQTKKDLLVYEKVI